MFVIVYYAIAGCANSLSPHSEYQMYQLYENEWNRTQLNKIKIHLYFPESVP